MTDQIEIEPTLPTPPESPHHCSKRKRAAAYATMLAVALLIGAVGYGYYAMYCMHTELTQTAEIVKQHSDHMDAVQQSVGSLETGFAKAADLSTKQEQLMTEWHNAQKGDLDKWRLAEAEYLVKMANDHLLYTHDSVMAITLLQRADETLSMVQNNSVIELRKLITADIASLQAAPAPDTTSIYLHVNALDGQLEQLPLPVDPLQSNLNQVPAVEIPANTPWWKAGLIHTWATLHKFIIVRNMGTQTLPLIFPEEKIFLYQNLHAKLQNAMWAVLYRQQDVYQASLDSVITWVQKYFVQTAPETVAILQNLQELKKIDIKPVELNLDETLQMFHSNSVAAAQPRISEKVIDQSATQAAEALVTDDVETPTQPQATE